MNVMLYSGYLKNIPIALEEAAFVDGATTWSTYWKIIFPIMTPMHATVAVLTALGTWNDVMTPLVIMSGTGVNTLPNSVRYELQLSICLLPAGAAANPDFLSGLSEADHQRRGKRCGKIISNSHFSMGANLWRYYLTAQTDYSHYRQTIVCTR